MQLIGRLCGMILEKQPPQVLLETHGVGYEIQLPMSCFYHLPEEGQEAIIFTQFVVREEAQLLYGFNDKQERALFRELIKVNGVGPKLALSILSEMSAPQFIYVVAQKDISKLIKLPGVGKKTAERLLVEIKDRIKGLKKDLFTTTATPVSDLLSKTIYNESEAVLALIALGYKPPEASRLINKIARDGMNCETLIRDALRATL